MEARNFDTRHFGELLKHFEKQNKALTEAKTLMLRGELRLKVEEDLLMRKLYEVMSAHGLTNSNYSNFSASCNTGAEPFDDEVTGANREQ